MTSKFTHLSQEQRYQIEALKTAGHSQKYIADFLSVNKSTISRELSRNSTKSAKSPEKYKAIQAQLFAKKRAFKPDRYKSANKDIERRISWLLKHDWSPEQIASSCGLRGIKMLSTEGIYLWIYSQARSPVDYTSYLRRHHRKRRKRKLKNQPRTIIKNRTSIHDRPPEVIEQLRFGDMETDLVKCQNGYLLTITERKSLFNLIVKLPNKEALTIQIAIIAALSPIKKQYQNHHQRQWNRVCLSSDSQRSFRNTMVFCRPILLTTKRV
jgi:IS30 family transposase